MMARNTYFDGKKKFYLLLVFLLMLLVISCQKSQFSTTTRHYRNGKVTYSHHHPAELSNSSRIKKVKHRANTRGVQIPDQEKKEIIIAAGSEESILLPVNDDPGVFINETGLSNIEPREITKAGSYKDTLKSNDLKKVTSFKPGKRYLIQYKSGNKEWIRIISHSNDTLVYSFVSERDVIRTTSMENVDSIIPDPRKIEPLGIIGVALSVLSFAALIVFAPYVGIPFAVAGVFLGFFSLRRIKRNKERFKGKGFAYVAIILGISGFITIMSIQLASLINACSSVYIRF